MQAREWLNRGFDISQELYIKKMMRDTIINVVSKTDTDGSKKYNAGGNNCENAFIKWSLLNAEVERMEIELLNIDRNTAEILRNLRSNKEREVLYLRYVKRVTWRKIGQILNMKPATMFRHHANGIKHICTIVNENFDLYF
jgi:DNA-directed RNA polymerase specialized sigma subunit